jgi:hypothetical protein
LISAIGLRAETIFKIEFHALPGTSSRHFTAEFFHETRTQEFFVQTETREGLHAERKKRLAYVESREFITFEHDHAAARTCENRGRYAPSRAAPDDGNVIKPGAHSAIKVAKFVGKQIRHFCYREVSHLSAVVNGINRDGDEID